MSIILIRRTALWEHLCTKIQLIMNISQKTSRSDSCVSMASRILQKSRHHMKFLWAYFTFECSVWTLILFLFTPSATFPFPPQMSVLSLLGRSLVRQPPRNASPLWRDSSTSSSKSNREWKTWSPYTPMDPPRYRTMAWSIHKQTPEHKSV